MRQTSKNLRNLWLGTLILVAAGSGFVLAKIAPLQSAAKHLKEPEITVRTSDSTQDSTETSTSQPEKTTESSKEDPEVTYLETTNQKIVQKDYQGRLAIPLILQNDSRWSQTAYGEGNPEGDNLANNGCAIVSLTMIAAYLDQTTYEPQTVLDWAKNDYYLAEQGTTWAIFSDFAQMKGYQFEDLEMDQDAVKHHLEQQHPILVSVKPGKFTENGHIMVVSGLDGETIWLNDPNDNASKKHSQTAYPLSDLANESLNFWTIYKG